MSVDPMKVIVVVATIVYTSFHFYSWRIASKGWEEALKCWDECNEDWISFTRGIISDYTKIIQERDARIAELEGEK